MEVRPVAGKDPSSLRKKVAGQGYDQVWLVVDQDDHSPHQLREFIAGCQQSGFQAVMSVPCFEVWLNAHYERVKKYADQQEAQRNYMRLTGLPSQKATSIPDSFPFHEYVKACGNARLKGQKNPHPNTLGDCPATLMPFLLQELGLVNTAHTHG